MGKNTRTGYVSFVLIGCLFTVLFEGVCLHSGLGTVANCNTDCLLLLTALEESNQGHRASPESAAL